MSAVEPLCDPSTTTAERKARQESVEAGGWQELINSRDPASGEVGKGGPTINADLTALFSLCCVHA